MRCKTVNKTAFSQLLFATIIITCLIVPGFFLAGCKSDSSEDLLTNKPNYTRPLEYGGVALREVTDLAKIRNLLQNCYNTNDATLNEAMASSISWYEKPSAATHFPIAGITYEKAKASINEFSDILKNKAANRDEFVNAVTSKFSIFESVGWDGRGTVLFTGYYSPEFKASRNKSTKYRYPLYKRPADLVTDKQTGAPLGRQVGTQVVPYPTRKQIETANLLLGTELVWLADPLDAYIIHVNGSAKLSLADGTNMYVGYAGKTDRPYTSLGQTLIKDDLISADEMSLTAIRKLYKTQPDAVMEAAYKNECYIFFQEYSANSWPAGSLGFRVTEKRTLATDKAIFPRGGIIIVDTRIPTYTNNTQQFTRFMLDQDTGGAIKAPGRADIYLGQGKAAEIIAGRQYQEGQLFYLFLK